MRSHFGLGAALAVIPAFLNSSGTCDTIWVPDDHALIRLAIEAAQDGDEVVVRPGTYFGHVSLAGKAITLRSTDPTDPAVVAATVLDGKPPFDPDNSGSSHGGVMSCNNDEGPDTIISGFTITHGDAHQVGGGMVCYRSSPTVTHCVFIDNTAFAHGGGIGVKYTGHPTVVNCSFINNTAGGSGGGLSGVATVIDSTFIGNVANHTGTGGGISTRGDAVVERCSFLGNDGGQHGGGIAISGYFGGSVTIRDCEFSGNEASRGGALSNTSESSALILDCTFQGNYTSAMQGEGGAVWNTEFSTPTYVRCTFDGNGASQGGGMSNTQSNPLIVGCFFLGNEATAFGGGVYNSECALNMVNCLFAGNTAGQFGGGVHSSAGGELALTNCTLVDNTGVAGAGLSTSSGVVATVDNCVVWNNTPDAIIAPPSITVRYSNVQGGFAGDGNIDVEPGFVDPDGPDNDPGTLEDNNYELGAGSPCIDAGDNTAIGLTGVTVDLAGNIRFVDDPNTDDTGVGEPPIVDMGAFEFQAFMCPADLTGDAFVDAADLATVLGNWGSDPTDPDADINNDGVVDAADLALVLGAWGECP